MAVQRAQLCSRNQSERHLAPSQRRPVSAMYGPANSSPYMSGAPLIREIAQATAVSPHHSPEIDRSQEEETAMAVMLLAAACWRDYRAYPRTSSQWQNSTAFHSEPAAPSAARNLLFAGLKRTADSSPDKARIGVITLFGVQVHSRITPDRTAALRRCPRL